MMERSSKFLSLSGWEGITAGIYALIGAFIVYQVFGFNPDQAFYGFGEMGSGNTGIAELIGTAVLVLWAFGFGFVHIIYGIFMHFRYER
jgi:vacuolar-type H+-ATPase subunit I/STV1